MNKKISVGLMLTIVFVSVATAIAITMSVSMKIYNSLIEDLPQRTQMYSSIAEIDELVRANYYGEINEYLLNSNLSDGYALGLGDKYSYYMTADKYEEFSSKVNGSLSTIGIIPELNPDTGYIHVVKVFDNSPAQSNSIVAGDEIVSINNETVTSSNYESMVKLLSGDKFTQISVVYNHGDAQKKVNLVLGFDTQTVSYELSGTVGIIRISAFYKTTEKQLESAIKALQKQSAKSLIIDVRNCSEGTIKSAASTVDIIVPIASEGNGAIALAQNAEGTTIETFTADADSITLPIVVLTNGKTSGAAELFACTLKDYGRASLVGTVTKGNGTMQSVFQLSDGGAVMLTVATILPYKSESYNEVGVAPDYVVELSENKLNRLYLLDVSQDDQMQKAFSLLTEN